jgi:hypothetical protein
MSNKLLTVKQEQHKDEMITLAEQVLDANGKEYVILNDSKIISKISEEQLRELIERVRRKKKIVRTDSQKEDLDIVPVE